jgi:hypothetical protein
MRTHCVDCYYWGRTCGFGKGRISAIIFKQGDSSKFCKVNMSWKNMIPDLCITVIPLLIGIFLLIWKFEVLLLIAILLMIIASTVGNGFVRGVLTCKHCKQKELGCPAEKLFNKETNI